MTNNENLIINYLKEKNYISPTEIGNKLGPIGSHFSWASPICLRLVKKGLLIRNLKGHYKLKDKND